MTHFSRVNVSVGGGAAARNVSAGRNAAVLGAYYIGWGRFCFAALNEVGRCYPDSAQSNDNPATYPSKQVAIGFFSDEDNQSAHVGEVRNA